MKRFFREVAVRDDDPGFRIELDGRPIRTPVGAPLRLPSLRLAEAVAEEWRLQADEIRPHRMPLNKLATSAIDLLPVRRPDAVAEIMSYAETDVLCYRAERPPELARRQDAAWQPWLEWAARELRIELHCTRVVAPLAQPLAVVAGLEDLVGRLNDWRLLGLHAAVRASGSLILALALERGQLAARQAFELANLDELFEIERWGEEAEQQQRLEWSRDDLHAAETFFLLLD